MPKLPEGFVLDKDENDAQIEGLPPGFTVDVDPMDEMGGLEKTRKALQYGAANALTGVGRTAEWAGLNKVGPSITNFGKDMAPEGYRPASADFFDPQEKDKGIGGYSWSHLPRAVLEGAPGMAVDLGAGAIGTAVAGPAGGAGAFMASNAARGFGPNMDARMANQAPGAAPTATDYAVGAGNTALQAYLSKLGIKGGLGIAGAAEDVVKGAGMKAIGQLPGQIAKAGAINAADGAAQSVIDQTARTAGTEHGLDVSAHEALGTAAQSGVTGAAVRAARAPGDVVNAARFADVDADAAGRVVNRFDKIDTDPKDASSAYKAVSEVRKNIATEIRNTLTQYKKDAKAAGEEVDLDTRNLVDTTIGRLKDGHTLNDGEIEAIAQRIGDRPEGGQLTSLLQEHHELNKLTSKGRFEHPNNDNPDGYFAGGISSTRPVENVLNPVNVLRKAVSSGFAGGAAAAGLAGLPLIGQLGITGATAAKVAVAQAGAYGGLRGVDRVLGLRNPTQEFITRFRADEAPAAQTFAKPSFKDQAAQQLADQQSQNDAARAQSEAARADRQQLSWDHQQALAENKRRDLASTALEKTVKAGEKDAQKAADKQYDRDWTNAHQLNADRKRNEAALQKAVGAGENLKAKNEAFEARKAETARQNAAREAERTLKQTVTEGQAEGVKRDMDAKKAQAALEKLAKAGEANLNKVNLRTNDFGADKTVKAMKAAEKAPKVQEKPVTPKVDDRVAKAGEANFEKVKLSAKDFGAGKTVKAMKAAEKLANKPEKAKEEPKVDFTVKPKAKAEKPASEAPKGSTEDVSADSIRVSVRGYDVERPRDTIRNEKAYVSKTQEHLNTRADLGDELESLVGKNKKYLVKTLINQLNKQARSSAEAYSYMEDFVNHENMPEAYKHKAFDIWNKHEAKVKATYRE
jgi:hypothetical protein